MTTAPGSAEVARYGDELVLAAATALLGVADRSLEGGVDRLADQHPFVGSYVAELAQRLPPGLSWSASVECCEQRLAELEHRGGDRLPLVRLRALGSTRDRLVLALVALPVEDPRFGAVAALLQFPVPDQHLSIQTVAAALDRPGERGTARLLSRLTHDRIVAAPDAASPTRRVSSRLWAAVRDPAAWADLVDATRPQPAGTLDHWRPERRDPVRRTLAALVDGRADTALVRQVPGADGERVVAAVLAELGTGMLRCTVDELRTEPVEALAEALGAVLCVVVDPSPGEELPPLRATGRAPLVVLAGRSGGVAAADGERRVSTSLSRSCAAERTALWAALQPELPPERLPELARTFLLPDGHLRRLSLDADALAAASDSARTGLREVRAAAHQLADHLLETRAHRVRTDGVGWDALVVDERVRLDLELLEQRCRWREQLVADGAPAGEVGVRALLTGPSGCGKTLAARVLAGELGRSLYRVDLSAVFDKYVGVTEKTLERLLREAEQLDVVLLLDEGDTLLGARTDVRSANDRYANLETNFLLQRLEDYSGILLVTTNAPDRVDGAFRRRMDAVIAFGAPGPAARSALWALHLPADHGLSPAEVTRLGAEHRLTGGQIRNAAHQTRLLGARAGRPVDLGLAVEAVTAEYRKAGAMPGGQPVRPPVARSVDGFLHAVAAHRSRGADRSPAR